jgi:acyl-coenzyme A synthetase/AMP-(fatty) acid ligase
MEANTSAAERIAMSDPLDEIRAQLRSSGNHISDGTDTISYTVCGEMVLNRSVSESSACCSLPVKNKLADAIQVTDHLVNKKNLFAYNGALDPISKPVFCNTLDIAQPGLSYLILRTSGTTSQPKFALHEQSSVLNNSKGIAATLGLSADDRVLIPTPIHHSYGLVTAFFPALIAGCSIRFVSNTNVVSLLDAIRAFKPTVMFATPGLIEMLVAVGAKTRIPKVTLTAGDRIRESVFIAYEKQMGKLLNLFGSTEMGAMGISPADQPVEHRAKGGLVPFPGVQLKVVAAKGDTLGTIECKNEFGFLGHLNSNGEVISPHQCDEWFNTKDLGSCLAGEILVRGRADHKINRSGILYSYFEIENAIERACEELQRVVLVKLTSSGMMGSHFAAVCELKKASIVDKKTIRNKCLRHLIKNIVPDVIEVVDEMPLLPNGKVNRVELQNQYAGLVPGLA